MSALGETRPGMWLVQLESPPVDGKANLELLALVVGHWGLRKSVVTLKSEASARNEWSKIEGSDIS